MREKLTIVACCLATVTCVGFCIGIYTELEGSKVTKSTSIEDTEIDISDELFDDEFHGDLSDTKTPDTEVVTGVTEKTVEDIIDGIEPDTEWLYDINAYMDPIMDSSLYTLSDNDLMETLVAKYNAGEIDFKFYEITGTDTLPVEVSANGTVENKPGYRHVLLPTTIYGNPGDMCADVSVFPEGYVVDCCKAD